jgi:uncharacterized membrane protein YbhN (UPF0104 family)
VSKTTKTFIQYTLIFGVTGVLIWVSLRGLAGEDKGAYLLNTWRSASKGWLIAMAVIAMISHVIRAERWRMLLRSSGQESKLGYSFLSLMVGYLINMAIPRGGELSRCYNLYKLENTPVETSFGTVVVERIVDLICLLALMAIAFIAEWDKLEAFLRTLPIGDNNDGSGTRTLVIIVAVIALLAGACYWLFKKNRRLNQFIRRTWLGFKDGLMSVFRLDQKGLFIFYSLAIWACYFLMSYTVILAFPETHHLGVVAVLSLFAIGSIAMAAPLPGGTGSYHVLVPQGLVLLYQIPQADAVAFTFIFHGWQTALLIAGGAISLVFTSVIVKRRR